jgi:hypothetical protein
MHNPGDHPPWIDSQAMADTLSSLIRPDAGPMLPAFERFAPPPPDNLVSAELAARTAPGDVVIDIHGRGGWIARTAISALRRVYACESTALTRLLAEVVLRPPDLRLRCRPGHAGDAAARRSQFRQCSIRCSPRAAHVQPAVIVDEFIWEPARRPDRDLPLCLLQEQAKRVRRASAPMTMTWPSRGRRRAVARVCRAARPLSVVDAATLPMAARLYTPRTWLRSALISRLRISPAAAPVDPATPGPGHALLSLSRLNGYPGRVAALRIRRNHVRAELARVARAQRGSPSRRLPADTRLHHPPRSRRRLVPAPPGRDLGRLSMDGNVVLRTDRSPPGGGALLLAPPLCRVGSTASRVRLVQPLRRCAGRSKTRRWPICDPLVWAARPATDHRWSGSSARRAQRSGP